MSKRIALATAAHLPELSEDDNILYRRLIELEHDATPVVWDSDADWSQYDVIVTRSIWDYHRNYPRFLKWLDQLDASGACIYNPTALMRWNADKHYMLDLAAKGVRVTPTRVVHRGEARSLADVVDETGWQRIVVKPTIASTGWETWQADLPLTEEHEREFARLKEVMSLLVQEFVPGVSEGERSFVFIGGEYSHTVLKRAVGDEFRVHIEWGGTVERIDPPRDQVEWARSVVATVEHPWMYGRVDAVPSDEGLVVMELEMLEPELFFAYNTQAIDKFIEHIL